MEILAGFVLITVLATVSVANAAFTDQLKITGTVTTGTVNANWDAIPGSFARDCEYEDRRGSLPTPRFATISAMRDSVNPKLVHFTIENAYPLLEIECKFSWTNHGTIPVKVNSLQIGALTSRPHEDEIVARCGGTSCSEEEDDDRTDMWFKVTFEDEPMPGHHSTCVYPSVGCAGAVTIEIEVLPGMPPGTTRHYTAHLNLVQAVP